MRIIGKYAELDTYRYDDSVVWRTIGVRARPESIVHILGQSKDEIVSMNRVFARIEVRRQEAREKIKWIKTLRATRYSDGSFPVVYTSTHPKTSVVERFYWAFNDINNPALLGEFSIRLEILTIQFDGNVKDLTKECPPCVDLVHPNDYSCCNDVGRIASQDEDIDGLLVPSARAIDGVNIPLFKGRATGNVVDVNAVTIFTKEALSSAEAYYGVETFKAGADNVYKQLRKL